MACELEPDSWLSPVLHGPGVRLAARLPEPEMWDDRFDDVVLASSEYKSHWKRGGLVRSCGYDRRG